jgi:hypothetical protein
VSIVSSPAENVSRRKPIKGARLASLAELVKEYKIGELALLLTSLATLCRDLLASDKLDHPIATDDKLSDFATCLEALAFFCTSCDADSSLIEQIHDFRREMLEGKADRREAVLHARLKAILLAVEHNLDARKFMYVPADQAPYWNSFFWFGEEFISTFPHTAKVELQELGNCRTAGRWTACVFHSMRLAEHGLRKLASSVKVKIIDKDRICKIEYADWQKVINAIRSKIAKTRLNPVGPKREQELQFFSDMNDHCEYMKDVWRNEMAHTRRFYEEAEALGVINRVKDFTQRLAKYDAEKQQKIRERRIRNF